MRKIIHEFLRGKTEPQGERRQQGYLRKNRLVSRNIAGPMIVMVTSKIFPILPIQLKKPRLLLLGKISCSLITQFYVIFYLSYLICC